ncbi:hypothetical protein V1477_003035, partial [Vespula maculifrons]
MEDTERTIKAKDKREEGIAPSSFLRQNESHLYLKEQQEDSNDISGGSGYNYERNELIIHARPTSDTKRALPSLCSVLHKAAVLFSMTIGEEHGEAAIPY